MPGLLYLRLAGEGVAETYLASDSEPLTAGHLRGLKLGKVSAVARSRPDLILMGLDDPDTPDVRATMAAIVPKRRRPQADDTFRLSPPTAGLTDSFLRDVARAYTAALARGESPNKALAAQTQTPQRSVERWVYLTRKAGHLPATRRGGVG